MSPSDPKIGPEAPSPQPDAQLKRKIYDVIFESDTPAGKFFDVSLLVLILLSVAVVCLETVEPIRAKYGKWLVVIEWLFALLFTCEYALRLYCVGNRRRYATSFYGLIDLLSVLPTYIELLIAGSGSFAIIRSFRLLRVFRIFKLFHLTTDAEGLAKAVWHARGKIVVFLTFVVISVTVSGALMYEIENYGTTDSQFTSIPQSIYWAVVTMTTVGYGDVVPMTTPGKMVSTLLILIGYSLIIVPSGFVSAELIESKRQRRLTNRTCPSCLLEGHEIDSRYCRACGHELV
jgi:voltage-gated potassium channel